MITCGHVPGNGQNIDVNHQALGAAIISAQQLQA